MNAQSNLRAVACSSLICLAFVLPACSTPESTKAPAVDVKAPDQGTLNDLPLAEQDLTGLDGEPDSTLMDGPVSDVATCEWPTSPLIGQPGSACLVDNDCDSGHCIETANGKLCTQTCSDCCPGGMRCLQLNEGDPVSLCLPASANLCRPCMVDDDCTANNKKALCLSYGDAGSFCGAPCALDADCAAGYACKDETGSSGASKQCRLKQGECSCSKLAAEQGAMTNCANTNSSGSCKGTRKCLTSGLSQCDGAIAVPETCNAQDDNCNGVTDDAGAQGCAPFWLDADKDGFGLAAPLGGKQECLCKAADLYTAASASDCNDSSVAISPAAFEVCNDIDDNCDGLTDEGCDDDGDGWCNVSASIVGSPKICAKGVGDCNDKVATTHPTADEMCNDADDNCNSLKDEGCDDDLDGYCDGKLTLVGTPAICGNGGSDCNDGDKTVHPGATETCNDFNDNCNGQTDEGCDDDGDGFCDAALIKVGAPAVCPKGGGDCNDNAVTTAPDVTETCDNIDDNCDGKTDEGCDDDKDGYCDAAMTTTGTPAACLSGAGDCDDLNPGISPAAPELCNGLDDNCSAKADEGCDDDGDGYCDAAMVLVGWPATCPNGGKDCADDAVAISPGATEVCANALDDNCDGTTDEGVGAIGCATFYLDGDSDKFGTDMSQCTCAPVGLYTAVSPGDCADYEAAIHPTQTESCNAKDDNCDGAIDEPGATGCMDFYVDADSDQYGTGAALCLCAPDALHTVKKAGDCSDDDPKKNPSLPETCDGFDNNCDGVTDGVDSVGCKQYYADNDGDTYGNPNDGLCLCAADAAHPVSVSGDCDDTNVMVSSGGKEACDGLDNNCDGMTDEPGATGCLEAYVDADGDGFGEGAIAQCVCKIVNNTVQIGGDCNDKNASVNPGATEKCNTLDDDCNGQTDEENSFGCTAWMFDADGDGFGIETKTKCYCGATLPYTTKTAGDCDDTNSAIKPTGTELCNNKDDNCDGVTDSMGALGCTVYYWDNDGDEYGVAAPASQCLCAAGPKYRATVAGDCDDADSMIHPLMDEYCDTKDNNCDGTTDNANAIGCVSWYADADADKWGLATDVKCLCGAQDKYTTKVPGDCNDSLASVHTGASELCNGMDDNCNGITDSDSHQATTYFYDGDNDGWGNTAMSAKLCFKAGFYNATKGGDCLDANPAVYPNATEVCNNLDDNCMNGTDETNSIGCIPYYMDMDGDGFGIATQHCQCKGEGNFTAMVSGDCNDNAPANNPGAPELCDGVDNNCDLKIDDENSKGCATWFADVDADSYGNPNDGRCLCAPQGKYSCENSMDCDDTKLKVHPGATENCNNLDDNCNSLIDEENAVGCSTYLYDSDGDTYGITGVGKCLCAPNMLTHFTAVLDGDCNDTKVALNPGAFEVCNNYDDNCDGTTDEGDAAGCLPWFEDADKDGYGSKITPSTCLCKASGKYTTQATGDCNDNAPFVHPNAYEACNSIDDNCDGTIDDDSPDNKNWYFDADGDSYGTAAAKKACFPTGGYTASQPGDCDDTRNEVFPGAYEYCNNLDDNCNAITDDDSPDASTWYYDGDLDTYGSSASVQKCLATGKYTATNGDDCDDIHNNAHPGSTEVCDGYDDNCDGVTDEENAQGCTGFSLDADADTFGVTGTYKCLCGAGVGVPLYTATKTGDCDDLKAIVNPGANEKCGDGLDNNCDGATDVNGTPCVTFYPDNDKDNYGGTSQAPQCLCAATGVFTTSVPGDCNDNNKDVHPGAYEACNNLDDNCNSITDLDSNEVRTWFFDADLDAYGTSASVIGCFATGKYTTKTTGDCNDSDNGVHPGAYEACNNKDDNCNGIVDDDSPEVQSYYYDGDGDSYGSSAFVTKCWSTGKYSATNKDDCDDSNSQVHPTVAEVCNGYDDNCDGSIDPQDATGCKNYMKDTDQDGYGLLTDQKCLCSAGLNNAEYTATKQGDCNDLKGNVNPGITEICGDNLDNNCDGLTDDASAGGCISFYPDADNDGYGGAQVAPQCLCAAAGIFTVTQDGDCDDFAATVNPGAFEGCNNVDDNCNGVTDADSPDVKTWYYDSDNDAYGTSASQVRCGPTDKYTATSTGDCNDANGAVHPGAYEACDGLDNNCNNIIDDDSPDAKPWYFDGDADSFGSTATITKCSESGKYTATNNKDCDDTKYLVHPGANESCNNYDDNCDTVVDEENALNCTNYMLDVDQDGHGVTGDAKCLCSPGLYNSTYTALKGSDCNDLNTQISPSAPEKCADNVDNNCDGIIDEPGGTGCVTLYTDIDKDGYGVTDPLPQCLCAKMGDFQATKGGDCDDSKAAVHPGAYEACNLLDDNCNGTVDDDSPDRKKWYLDADGDTYGTTDFVEKCEATGFYSALSTNDCKDTNSSINPGAKEICNLLDDNCNGVVDDDSPDAIPWYYDSDGDGYGMSAFVTKCAATGKYTSDKTGDCNDANVDVHPGVVEKCNGVDDGCDGVTDNGDIGQMCGSVVHGTPDCAGGKCVSSCNNGYFDVNGDLTDGCECTPDVNYNVTGGNPAEAIPMGEFTDAGQGDVAIGSIMPGETGDWYKFHAIDLPDADNGCDTFVVNVKFATGTDPGFVVDLYRGGFDASKQICGGVPESGWSVNFTGDAYPPANLAGVVGGNLPCPTGQSCSPFPSPNANAGGECPCYNHPSSTTLIPDLGVNYCTDNSAWYWVRVYRSAPASSCTNAQYTLKVRNGP